MARILLIEDDPDYARYVHLALADEGMDVHRCADGARGLREARAHDWDLILLDLMLPGIEGKEICRALRAEDDHTPLLMLTALSAESDRVRGLELGADDYLPKTVGGAELVARVRAALRRATRYSPAAEADPGAEDALSAGALRLDLAGRRVYLRGAEVALTATEFDLLAWFAARPGRAFSREDLLREVWGYDYEGYQHTVNTHINRLRAKIEDDPAQPRYIRTVWGVGYRFADAAELTLEEPA